MDFFKIEDEFRETLHYRHSIEHKKALQKIFLGLIPGHPSAHFVATFRDFRNNFKLWES